MSWEVEGSKVKLPFATANEANWRKQDGTCPLWNRGRSFKSRSMGAGSGICFKDCSRKLRQVRAQGYSV